MNRYLLIFILLALPFRGLHSQEGFTATDFDTFFARVLASNMDLLIQRHNVTIAEAAVVASRVFQDPELEVILPQFASENYSAFPRNAGLELEIPIELFGKRRARISLATTEHQTAQMELDDHLRLLRAQSAEIFIQGIAYQHVLERMMLTKEQLDQLIEINEILLEKGEAGRVDVLQTRLEAKNFQAEMYDLRAEYVAFIHEVAILTGMNPKDSIVFEGSLEMSLPQVSYEQLLKNALARRPDIKAAENQVKAGEYELKLARRERLPDLSLIAGYHNEEAISPVPGMNVAYAGVIIPLQFSGINAGEQRMAQAELDIRQTELNLARLEAEASVNKAWEKYRLSAQKNQLFTEEILSGAEQVRDAIVYSYQRGEVSLLEVLDAQRTINEVYMNYYETKAQHAEAIIELSKTSGQWMVEL